MIPVGLCQCGCGKPTSVATRTYRRWGHVPGQPVRFVRGHSLANPFNISSRFWPRVQKTENCWIWTGAKIGDGYGILMINGRRIQAHRVAWALEYGPVPSGISILHRCDNPPCVRPDHLFQGTAKDNLRDMVAKGRSARGEKNGQAKLTSKTVYMIRSRYIAGERQCDLMRDYNLSRTNAFFIVSGKTWGHVPVEIEHFHSGACVICSLI